jgi:hypothetical protein
MTVTAEQLFLVENIRATDTDYLKGDRRPCMLYVVVPWIE